MTAKSKSAIERAHDAQQSINTAAREHFERDETTQQRVKVALACSGVAGTLGSAWERELVTRGAEIASYLADKPKEAAIAAVLGWLTGPAEYNGTDTNSVSTDKEL